MKVAKRGDSRIESLRVIGALAVFLFHFMGDVETVLRPSIMDSYLWVLVREGSGPFGVSLFVVISGLVFTWSYPRSRNATNFVRRRIEALFPLFWWIALPLIVLAFVTHRMPSDDLWKVPIWLSGLGIVSAATFFPVVDAWWYMTLALQLVLFYPILRKVQEMVGIQLFVLGSVVFTVVSVWALKFFEWDYAIAGFAGSRLLEFAVGMTIGKYTVEGVKAWPPPGVFAVLTVALGACVTGLSYLALGNALAPAMVLLMVGIVGNASGAYSRWITAVGGISFAFYLSHSPWVKPILVLAKSVAPLGLETLIGGVFALMVAILVALGFHGTFLWANSSWRVKSFQGEK